VLELDEMDPEKKEKGEAEGSPGREGRGRCSVFVTLYQAFPSLVLMDRSDALQCCPGTLQTGGRGT
jgi:hypothetical protein